VKKLIASLVAVVATVGLALAQTPAPTLYAGPGDHHLCC
jgi:hypothetical protein